MSKRAPYYETVRLKKGGGEEKVLKCSTCDLEMFRDSWMENRGGLLYAVKGRRCPQCKVSKDEASVLAGPAGESG